VTTIAPLHDHENVGMSALAFAVAMAVVRPAAFTAVQWAVE
jgi:hypothetical protein